MKKKSETSGFTLVEIMIALVVLAIVLLGTFFGLGAGFRNSEDAKNLTIATNLAQEKMEDLINQDSSSVDLTAGDHSDTDTLTASTEYISFTRDWTVDDAGDFIPVTAPDPHSGTPSGNFKKITLAVKHTPSLVNVVLVRYVSYY